MGGEAKHKQYSRQQFLLSNPWCCYCGASATTTDHCPPRALFKNRHWPVGYEFPCCDPCNGAGRRSEQIAAAVLRPSLWEETEDEAWQRTIRSLSINRPDVIAEWNAATRNETRKVFRQKFGSELGDFLRHQQFGLLEVGPITTAAIEDVLFRLGQALFYKHVSRRCIGRVWVLRVDMMEMLDASTAMDTLARVTPLLAQSVRGNVDLSDQFLYRYNMNSTEGMLGAVVKIREQFGAMIVAMDEPHATAFSATPAGQRMNLRACPPSAARVVGPRC